jgi:hypothetical protein
VNCGPLIKSLGFSCMELGDETLRVWSPFTYSGDGERIGFYVEKVRNGYRVTDNCEALMQASAKGRALSQKRVQSVRNASDAWALSERGEIEVFADEGSLRDAMTAVLSTALAVSHLQTQWSPRFKSESFAKDVEEILDSTLPGRVLKKVSVTGASGHQLELPLAVSQGPVLIYVQPIAATDDSSVDWRRVYESWGRMTDLKNAHLPNTERLVVLQDASNDAELKHAVGILTESAPVVMYSRLRQWAERRRA